jgi:hypothetical protein
MGPGKYENVGKSQPDLLVINPILSPRTRINRHARGTPPSSAVRVGGGGGGASQIRNGRGESWVSWVQLFIASWSPAWLRARGWERGHAQLVRHVSVGQGLAAEAGRQQAEGAVGRRQRRAEAGRELCPDRGRAHLSEAEAAAYWGAVGGKTAGIRRYTATTATHQPSSPAHGRGGGCHCAAAAAAAAAAAWVDGSPHVAPARSPTTARTASTHTLHTHARARAQAEQGLPPRTASHCGARG